MTQDAYLSLFAPPPDARFVPLLTTLLMSLPAFAPLELVQVAPILNRPTAVQACSSDLSAPLDEPEWLADAGPVVAADGGDCVANNVEQGGNEVCELDGVTGQVCGTGAEKDDDGNCVCEVSWQEMNKDGNCVDNDDDGDGDGGDDGDGDGGDDGGGGGGGDDDDDEDDPNCTEDQEAIAEEYDDPVNWPCTKFDDEVTLGDGTHDHTKGYLNPKYTSGRDQVTAAVQAQGVSDVRISSDWRCPVGNSMLPNNPSAKSQHIQGTAGDFYTPGFNKDIYDKFFKAAQNANYGWASGYGTGKNQYIGHIHIDWR